MPTEISLKIDDRLYDRLSTLAKGLNVSTEDIVAEAILEKIQRYSGDDDARLCEYREELEQFKRDRLGVPHDEMSRYFKTIFDDDPLPLPECRKL